MTKDQYTISFNEYSPSQSMLCCELRAEDTRFNPADLYIIYIIPLGSQHTGGRDKIK